MAKQNGNKIIAEQRRSQVIQMKMAGATEQTIADQLGVSKAQVWNDVKRRLSEVRRDDAEASAKATSIVLDILRRLDTIGGLVPEKPLIQLNQQNVLVGGITFSDLVREALSEAGTLEVEGRVYDSDEG